MIFLTVGTQFPFDRLVRAVDDLIGEGLINETVFAQIGQSRYKPRNFESAGSLKKGVFDDYARKASGIIGHAGMGTITMALGHRKPLLVMPRLKKYREVVNDHQVDIAEVFSQLGHILMAYDTAELPQFIPQLKTFVPVERKTDPGAVTNRIINFLSTVRA